MELQVNVVMSDGCRNREMDGSWTVSGDRVSTGTTRVKDLRGKENMDECDVEVLRLIHGRTAGQLGKARGETGIITWQLILSHNRCIR